MTITNSGDSWNSLETLSTSPISLASRRSDTSPAMTWTKYTLKDSADKYKCWVKENKNLSIVLWFTSFKETGACDHKVRSTRKYSSDPKKKTICTSTLKWSSSTSLTKTDSPKAKCHSIKSLNLFIRNYLLIGSSFEMKRSKIGVPTSTYFDADHKDTRSRSTYDRYDLGTEKSYRLKDSNHINNHANQDNSNTIHFQIKIPYDNEENLTVSRQLNPSKVLTARMP